MVELIEAGSIGKPRYITANFGFKMVFKLFLAKKQTFSSSFKEASVLDPKTGGSYLMGIGVYLPMWSNFIFKGEEPERIKASGTFCGPSPY